MLKRTQQTWTRGWFVEPVFRAPALRPNRAEMSPAAFIGLVAAWSSMVGGLLCAAIVARMFG